MSNKVLVILGSHPRTRDGVPFDRNYVDVWTFNEASAQPWIRKTSAVFQMHLPAVWKNPGNLNDLNHRQWLTQPHDFPIYMLDKYEEVPASVKYPFEAVVADLIPKLVRQKGKEQIKIEYFTSSVAYALALAIHLKYDEIRLFGIEMDSGTEWEYQRPGVFFWLGAASARGIKIVIHEKSALFDDPLYGYEGAVTITDEAVNSRLKELTAKYDIVKKNAEAATTARLEALKKVSAAKAAEDAEALIQDFFAKIREESLMYTNLGALEGAIEEGRRYLQKAKAMEAIAGNHIFARQEFERTAAKAREASSQFSSVLGTTGGKAAAMWDSLLKESAKGESEERVTERALEYAEAHEAYLQASYQFGKANGIMQENLRFLSAIDRLIRAAGLKNAEITSLESMEEQPE